MPTPPKRTSTPGLAALALLLLPVLNTAARAFEEPGPWPFQEGDRIVLVGDTLIERDQRYGYLETFLTVANPELNLTFRNLGWSGDTVGGISRAGFERPEAGFGELVKQVRAARPTVLIVGYGMAESFSGAAGLAGFEAGLDRLLEAIAPAPSQTRLALISPIPHEDLGRPLPDPAEHNRALALYTEAIRTAAGRRHARFVDLYNGFRQVGHPCTDNGIHLTRGGYWHAAVAICSGLGLGLGLDQHAGLGRGPEIEIAPDGRVVRTRGSTVSEARATPAGLRFLRKDVALPAPTADLAPAQAALEPGNELRFPGLPAGLYALRIDGRETARAAAAEWDRGVRLRTGPEHEQVERLRQTINEKNRLFFHRWRPQNVTYLFGFRKHEQGNNAIEIPRFDPLVEAREREIARLRKPVPHVYELVRESEVTR